MPLIFERYRGHDFSRMVCIFSMQQIDKDDLIRCYASFDVMDDLERARGTRSEQREAQFGRLADKLREMASRKFYSFAEGSRPNEILLTTADLTG